MSCTSALVSGRIRRKAPGMNRCCALLAALVLAGCGGTVPSPRPSDEQAQPSCAAVPGPSLGCIEATPLPSGGITREAAIAAARQSLAGGTSAAVVWASVETSPLIPNQVGPVVWEVRLAGGLSGLTPCPSGWLDHWPTASDPPCADSDGGIVVVLDYSTGALIGWAH